MLWNKKDVPFIYRTFVSWYLISPMLAANVTTDFPFCALETICTKGHVCVKHTYTCSLVQMQYSPADMWKKCAFSDTSMKFGTLLGQYLTKKFGYRDISDSSQSQNDGHFTKWPIWCCAWYRMPVDALYYWRSIPVVTHTFEQTINSK